MNIRQSYFAVIILFAFSWLVNAQDKKEVQSRSSDTGPSWADSQGEVIGFSSKRSGNYNIYIRHLGSGKTLPLIADSADQHYPVWSPDGTRIAYQTQIGDNKEIFIYEIGSGIKTNLTNHPASDGDDYPCWSKDGKSIFFTSVRNGSRDIFRKMIDSDDVEPVATMNSDEINPSISPNGEQIAFASNKSGNYDIYVMNLDGSELRQVTNHESNEMFPTWHPSGSALVFQRRTAFRQSDIISIELDGSGEKNLTSGEGLKFYPRMSRDGQHVLFMSGSEAGTFIYTLEISTGEVKQVSGR